MSKLPIYLGFDHARPGSDKTVYCCVGDGVKGFGESPNAAHADWLKAKKARVWQELVRQVNNGIPPIPT